MSNAPSTLASALSVDAVAASVDLGLQPLVDRLSSTLNAEPRTARPIPGRGYSHAVDLHEVDSDRCICKVMYGSAHSKPHVYAVGTESFDAPATHAALERIASGLWLPSRLDVALDFEDGDWFDLLADHLTEIALRKDIAISHQGDWERNRARTLYIGSRASPFFIRLYEFRAHHGFGPCVRLELEVKVKPRLRAELASLAPAQILSCCPTVRELLERFAIDVPGKLSPGHRPQSTIERDRAFLASCAYPALLRMIAHHGGDLAAALGDIIDHRAESDRIKLLLQCATIPVECST